MSCSAGFHMGRAVIPQVAADLQFSPEEPEEGGAERDNRETDRKKTNPGRQLSSPTFPCNSIPETIIWQKDWRTQTSRNDQILTVSWLRSLPALAAVCLWWDHLGQRSKPGLNKDAVTVWQAELGRSQIQLFVRKVFVCFLIKMFSVV